MICTLFMGALSYALINAVGGTHMDAIERRLQDLANTEV